jgi:rhamnopyranosyl-N-acetylglucosaminyl-diphospho-decaprenol beta-1,3/1,4-galactofuranosyltransferase
MPLKADKLVDDACFPDKLAWYKDGSSATYGVCLAGCESVPQGKEKIAAIVVTYNRKGLLGQCVDSLLAQTHALDAIYVIDNHSTDGTYDYLLGRDLIAPVERPDGGPIETTRPVSLEGFPDRRVAVHYVAMPENTGGAGGFHEGIRRAADAGFDWLWLMDDDLLTAADALQMLVRKKDALQSLRKESFLLNSLVLARDRQDGDALAFPLQELSPIRSPKSGIRNPKRGVYHWRLSEVRSQVKDGLYPWACPFNGTFLPARAVAEVGLPNKDFFIWGDEKDYLWRAARRFNLYTAVDSKVYHPPPRDAGFDWRQYYNIRNMIIVNRHFNFTAVRNLRLILLSLAKGLRHGRSGLTLVLRAIRDGLTGRLGKRDDLGPHMWPSRTRLGNPENSHPRGRGCHIP